MTDWLEVLIYFIAACIGIFTMTNVVNLLDKGTKNLPPPAANAILMGIFLLILVMLPQQVVNAKFNKTTHIES